MSREATALSAARDDQCWRETSPDASATSMTGSNPVCIAVTEIVTHTPRRAAIGRNLARPKSVANSGTLWRIQAHDDPGNPSQLTLRVGE